MHNVKVGRVNLLGRIQKNRQTHKEQYENAVEEYKQAVIVELEEWLEKAKAGKDVRRMTVLDKPEDHTEEYDRVIDMLEMSVDEEITLDANSFNQYVRDEWHWKERFGSSIRSTSAYLGARSEKSEIG